MNAHPSIFSQPDLPEVGSRDFPRAVEMLQARAGIVLGAHKRDMAERALGLRAKGLGVTSINDYLNYLEGNASASEWQEFINTFTINHTAFFREEHHFGILAKFVQSRPRPIAVWSAAASTGEEPYSIAIQLRESLSNPDHQVSVWATDIDTQALAVAKAGIYTLDRVRPVPDVLLKKYFQRGTGTRAGMARVKTVLRNMVEFDSLNLVTSSWQINRKFDAIFCRNTLIYFDKEQQAKILHRFARLLKPGGLLFAGHSENLTYLTDSFRLLGQTVYELV